MVRFWWNLVFRTNTLQTKIAPIFIEIGLFLVYELVHHKYEKLSDFNKIWCDFDLKCADSKYQVSSKSDHFWALSWSWNPQFWTYQPNFWICFITNIKIKLHKVMLQSKVAQTMFILLVASEFKMATTAELANGGQKYFTWLTCSMIGWIDISFKIIGDFEFRRLFVT